MHRPRAPAPQRLLTNPSADFKRARARPCAHTCPHLLHEEGPAQARDVDAPVEHENAVGELLGERGAQLRAARPERAREDRGVDGGPVDRDGERLLVGGVGVGGWVSGAGFRF